MSQTPQELAKNCSELASFSDVAFKIDTLLADENSGAVEFSVLIEADPALSASLLRIANSAMYNPGGSVSSIDRAVTIVGLREVRNLAYAISATETFRGIPNELIAVEDFWKHSLFCATAAQHLGQVTNACPGESLFTAGLLHDIGQLVMFNQCPELSQKALKHSLDTNDGLSPYLSEREVFGFDHMQVGAALAQLWKFPEFLRACIEFHHEPFQNDKYTDAKAVIHIANSLAVLAEIDSTDFDEAPPMDERALEQLGASPTVISETITAAQENTEELLRLFITEAVVS